MAERLDDQGRPWSGDYHRQRILTQRIQRVIDGKEFVDIMAALGTVTANLIADLSTDEAEAMRGLAAHHGDLQSVVKQRFARKTAH
ncbi:hypothetical protein [Methylobacterium sp. PvR107]|uniref:hypothetical protein n=1 Tax=Methylobacterium sp. PvR107 TaxID=2806597 RepID=UPI001AE132D3|nr:hypothetical protein [Methylobacterium sp. PvR107]MBP1180023.1 hypothetical protein [Methylobacterium sp. PvR107]